MTNLIEMVLNFIASPASMRIIACVGEEVNKIGKKLEKKKRALCDLLDSGKKKMILRFDRCSPLGLKRKLWYDIFSLQMRSTCNQGRS